MADKREIRHIVRRLESIKTWQLVILLVMLGFLAMTFLRLNNIGMVERRDAVWAADREGDDVALEKRLYDLQRYVSAHMNTDPGRVQLEHKYNRDNDQLKAELESQTDQNPNGNVYKNAADVCDPIGRAQGWRWPDPRYTNCIQQELDKYPEASELKDGLQPLPTAPYYHSFASPWWSPDFAGWTLVVCAVVLTIIVLRLIALIGLRLIMRFRYRKV